jgi:hypothetical protein
LNSGLETRKARARIDDVPLFAGLVQYIDSNVAKAAWRLKENQWNMCIGLQVHGVTANPDHLFAPDCVVYSAGPAMHTNSKIEVSLLDGLRQDFGAIDLHGNADF